MVIHRLAFHTASEHELLVVTVGHADIHYLTELVRYHIRHKTSRICCFHASIAGGMLHYRNIAVSGIRVQTFRVEHETPLLLLLLFLLLSLLSFLLYRAYRARSTCVQALIFSDVRTYSMDMFFSPLRTDDIPLASRTISPISVSRVSKRTDRLGWKYVAKAVIYRLPRGIFMYLLSRIFD